ncbi:MAG TPA: PQQ-dependent sugar dehydrogenase [Acidobacteriaceae bacterium]
MNRKYYLLVLLLLPAGTCAVAQQVLTGQSAFTDYTKEAPGVRRKLTAADLPKPFATPSVDVRNTPAARPANAWPAVPKGFKVELYASDIPAPRLIRTAPNGDLFVAASESNQILVFRGVTDKGKPKMISVFTTEVTQPFGINFYPKGPNPKYVYIGNTDSVVRFAYTNGDLKATGHAEKLADIPGGGRLRGGGHWTRDVVFSKDGEKMFVSVGSHSNVDDADTHPEETHRANVLQFTPEGKFVKVYASGIRNCVGEAIHPVTGELWCSTNERDALGDNLVPDYVTHIEEDGFYGWPWWYMGPNQDPRHAGKHPELKDKVITPDVLLQPHNASLQMTFLEGKQFPAQYGGDAFAAEHGSWNKRVKTGYELIRVPMKNGHATGEYEDFMTGFVTPEGNVWGRPVGVTEGADGSLFVTDDGSNSIWHIVYTGK